MPWMRWNVPPTGTAITWARSVLPTPGMSSVSRWPNERRDLGHVTPARHHGGDGVDDRSTECASGLHLSRAG